ncbi:MAG: hypothetical protein ACI3VZ_01320 [Faecousia sp.]
MPLIKAICSGCGSPLEVDFDNVKCVCEYCGTPYLIEKSTNQINIGAVNINAAEYRAMTLEAQINNAYTYLNKQNDIESAYRLFSLIADDYPHECRAWLGIVDCLTVKLTFLDITPITYSVVEDSMERAIAVTDQENASILSKKWENYKQQYGEYIHKCTAIKDKQKDIKERIQKNHTQIVSKTVNKSWMYCVIGINIYILLMSFLGVEYLLNLLWSIPLTIVYLCFVKKHEREFGILVAEREQLKSMLSDLDHELTVLQDQEGWVK